MSQAVAADRRWLFGPLPDLFLGCGLAYGAVFVLQTFAGGTMRSWLPLGLMPLVAIAFSVPHYGATLLRVYERRDDRRAYVLFGVWTTLLLGLLFLWGLNAATVGCWLITVYLTWSPWHYSGQNYGVALMFLRRRGVDVTPTAKRLFHLSFWLSFGLAFFALHGPDPVASYAPDGLAGNEYRFLPLDLPAAVRDWALIGVGGGYLVCTGGSLWLLSRKASIRDLAPAVLIVAMQALWFSVPAVARNFHYLGGIEPIGIEQVQYTFLWVAVGHAIQYLWITSYFARKSGAARGNLSFYGKALVAGSVVWTVPVLVFAPGLMGRVPFDAGLALVVASIVNIHHFILDGAIWKLRKGPIARILIRDKRAEDADAPRGRRWGWPVTACLGTACVVIAVTSEWQTEMGFNRPLAAQDRDTARSSAELLARLGRDSADRRFQLGLRDIDAGALELAEEQFDKGLALYPTQWLWWGKGMVALHREQPAEAEAAIGKALKVDPEHVHSLFYLSQLAFERGDRAKARWALGRAVEHMDYNPTVTPALRAEIESWARIVALSRHR